MVNKPLMRGYVRGRGWLTSHKLKAAYFNSFQHFLCHCNGLIIFLVELASYVGIRFQICSIFLVCFKVCLQHAPTKYLTCIDIVFI